jgi:hypothetical protein
VDIAEDETEVDDSAATIERFLSLFQVWVRAVENHFQSG